MTEKEFNTSILPLTHDIFTFAVHLTGDRSGAADITQDVMYKLWEMRRELRKVQNPKAWALKITRNLCLDILKKQKPLYDEEQMYKNSGYDHDLLRSLEDKETAALVKQIIDTLPDNQREVVILREIEEMEYNEIAEITGLGLNNIRVLLSRARTKIKEILIKQYSISKYE